MGVSVEGREVHDRLIEGPEVWRTADIGGKEGLVRGLDAEELAAFETMLERTSRLAPQEPTRRDFDHPVINRLMAELRELILRGRGAVILRGITRDRYSEDAMERIYWGMGTHLGEAAIQSGQGNRLGHVMLDKNNPHRRGHRDTVELRPHTDSYEIVGLMCLQQGASGGLSLLANRLAIHNEFLRTRPDLLPALYRGFPNGVLEARFTATPVTPYNVPVFSSVNGVVTCMYTRMFIQGALDQLKIDLPPDFSEAIDMLEMLAQRDDLCLKFMLEPGEILLWNNFTMMHARTAFENSATRERHLLRLWLNVPNGRPVIPEVFAWGDIYKALYAA
jgi:hypothetical protein